MTRSQAHAWLLLLLLVAVWSAAVLWAIAHGNQLAAKERAAMSPTDSAYYEHWLHACGRNPTEVK